MRGGATLGAEEREGQSGKKEERKKKSEDKINLDRSKFITPTRWTFQTSDPK